MSDIPDSFPITRDRAAGLREVGHSPDERQFVAMLSEADGGWLPMVHWFAADGAHLECDHAGPIASRDEAEAQFEAMLRRLEPYQKDTVNVSPFETEIAGTRVGLIPDPAAGTVRLEPLGLVYGPPWDGRHRT